MALADSDLDYFARGGRDNRKFWSRFGGEPEMAGLRVLDVGCGHGRMCIDLANHGAAAVVGVDVNANWIAFARENLASRFPAFQSRVTFHCCDVRELAADRFDTIVSKDAFEHIMNLESVMADLAGRLVPGGRLYAGFGPLYNSPFGDHGRSSSPLPWGHLFFRESWLIRRLQRRGSADIRSLGDLGLNRLSLADYRRILGGCGLKVVQFRVNASRNPVSRGFSLFRRLPGLEEYFSHNLYVVLEKPGTRSPSGRG
jgi:SAM-dependent methyltransferase